VRTCVSSAVWEEIAESVGTREEVLAADGFEKVELTGPVTALRADGAEVDIVSLRPGRIRGVNLHEPASRVTADRPRSEASVDEYVALLIPGGFINPDLLCQSAEAREFVRRFDGMEEVDGAAWSGRRSEQGGKHGGIPQ
jgi:putative intracellular protease/amidase